MWLYTDDRDKFKLTARVPKGFKEAVEAIEDAANAQPFTVSTMMNILSLTRDFSRL